LIREINVIPSNAFIVINLDKKIYKLHYIDYKENTIPLDSEEGLKIIDKWMDKWGYIFRSLKSQTNQISSDLSGGLDTRTQLSIILNSGIDMNDILVNSITDKKHDHQVDFEIASNISNYYGFKLNKLTFNNSGIIWRFKDTLFKSLYLKLGFHKEFHFNNKFYHIPRFGFTGFGGEFLRGTGTNSHTNQGSGSNVGVHQDSTAIDMNINNASRVTISTPDSSYNTGEPRTWYENQNLNDGVNYTIRPTNTSVLYCIKA
jgi:hypothetical protein